MYQVVHKMGYSYRESIFIDLHNTHVLIRKTPMHSGLGPSIKYVRQNLGLFDTPLPPCTRNDVTVTT